MRPLLCFSRRCLGSGLLRLSFLGRYITLRGGLVLLGLAFLLHRFVSGYGPDRFLGPALHVFRDAFDARVRSRLIRHDRLPPSCYTAVCSAACCPAIWGTNAARQIGAMSLYEAEHLKELILTAIDR